MFTSLPCDVKHEIPEAGAKVIDGFTGDLVKCLRRGKDENTTEVEFKGKTVPIAAQCCLKDTPKDDENYCKRYVDSHDQDGCIGGKETLNSFTYSENVAECARRSTENAPLELCESSCARMGCGPYWEMLEAESCHGSHATSEQPLRARDVFARWSGGLDVAHSVACSSSSASRSLLRLAAGRDGREDEHVFLLPNES